MSEPKTLTEVDATAIAQLVSLTTPNPDPTANTLAGSSEVQLWDTVEPILPDLGNVDNKILAAGGLSNTILISTETAEILRAITVRVGSNGNWFVGDTDTGISAVNTDVTRVVRMSGMYVAPSQSFTEVTQELTVSAGGQFVVYGGAIAGYLQFAIGDAFTVAILDATKMVTIDELGVVHQYDSDDVRLVPYNEVPIGTIDGVVGSRTYTAFPETLNMFYDVLEFVKDFAEAEQSLVDLVAAAAQSATNAGTYSIAASASMASAAASASASAASATAANDTLQVIIPLEANVVALEGSTQSLYDSVVILEGEADASRLLAEKWAEEQEDTEVIAGKYSALHWAAKAQAYALSIANGVKYQGLWDASAGDFPTFSVGPQEVVDYYRISVSGTMTSTDPAQEDVFVAVGELLFEDVESQTWYKLAGGGITEINGQTPDPEGLVTVEAQHIPTLSGSDVQQEIDDLNADVTANFAHLNNNFVVPTPVTGDVAVAENGKVYDISVTTGTIATINVPDGLPTGAVVTGADADGTADDLTGYRFQLGTELFTMPDSNGNDTNGLRVKERNARVTIQKQANGRWGIAEATFGQDADWAVDKITNGYSDWELIDDSSLFFGTTNNRLLARWEDSVTYHIVGFISSNFNVGGMLTLPKYNREVGRQYRPIVARKINTDDAPLVYVEVGENILKLENAAASTWIILDITLILKD